MFVYDKKLQYPIRITNPNPKLAAIIISQYGGPDGELGASLRYLSQRYSMPFDELKGLLTDIGTEELGHLEMIGTIVHQLTRKLSDSQIREAGFAPYFHRCLSHRRLRQSLERRRDRRHRRPYGRSDGGSGGRWYDCARTTWRKTLENTGFFVVRVFSCYVCKRTTYLNYR